MLLVVIPVLFVIVAYILFTVADSVRGGRRVRGRMGDLAVPVARREPEEGDAAGGVRTPASSSGPMKQLQGMLRRAGVMLRPSEFIGIAAGASLALAILFQLAFRSIGASLLGLFIGGLVPFVVLRNLEARRLAAFDRQLPDALSLICAASRSGYSFQRAMQMVSEELPPPISDELRKVIDELNTGMSVERSLSGLVTRLGSYDLELVVTAIIIHQQVGGNLAEILENIGATIRERIRIEGELSVLTAEGRMSGIILSLLPFALGGVMLLVHPGYFRPLIAEPFGWFLVALALVAQIFGALVIRRMVTLDF